MILNTFYVHFLVFARDELFCLGFFDFCFFDLLLPYDLPLATLKDQPSTSFRIPFTGEVPDSSIDPS